MKKRTCFFCGSSNEIEISPMNWVSEETGDDITILKPVCVKCRKIEEFSKDRKYYSKYFKRNSEYVQLDPGLICGDCGRETEMISIYSMPENCGSENGCIERKLVAVYCSVCNPHRAVMKIEKMKTVVK